MESCKWHYISLLTLAARPPGFCKCKYRIFFSIGRNFSIKIAKNFEIKGLMGYEGLHISATFHHL